MLATDKAAQDLYTQDQSKAISYLTDFSCNQGENTLKTWKQLYRYLFTKYLDGNIKEKDGDKQNPKVKQPGYSPEYYRNLIEKTGDRYKVIK